MLDAKKIINRKIKEIEKKQGDISLQRIHKILERKDIIDLDNEKVDTLRMLLMHLEKDTSATRFVNFLKK